MAFIIDAHQDMAYNYVAYRRDYRRSVSETRKLEANTYIPAEADHTLLGWEEYQRGQIALIFGTLYLVPGDQTYPTQSNTLPIYHNADEARKFYRMEMDYYNMLDQSGEDKFRLVRSRSELSAVLAPWSAQPAKYPDVTHPVGLLMSIEGLEGVGKIQEIDDYWQMGVRAIGPVWSGGRFCGGTIHHGGFSDEGYELLKIMSRIGYILDLSHMTDLSARQALDVYDGTVIASHANARALLGSASGERHFTDEAIRSLAARDSVMGIVPFNRFLKTEWKKEDPNDTIPMQALVEQIDYICQLTGSSRHVSFGTDFDGGFGYLSVPEGINTIADMQKMAPLLADAGYKEEDINNIFSNNWQRVLESGLPV